MYRRSMKGQRPELNKRKKEQYDPFQVLRNAVGGGRVSDFLEKNITKMFGSTLLALRENGR